jgi:Cytochrome c, mono- and diheme variants
MVSTGFFMKLFYGYKTMKTILTVVALSIIGFANSAMAADADKGKDIFSKNCSTCHSGGRNVMASGKSLSKEDLETNKVNSAAAIIEIVTNGKPPMPAFGKLGTIDAADIENVAAYVLKKANAGW